MEICEVFEEWDGSEINNVKNVPINPLTAEWVLRALIDFTLSNARRFYSSMGNPLDGKGLIKGILYDQHIILLP